MSDENTYQPARTEDGTTDTEQVLREANAEANEKLREKGSVMIGFVHPEEAVLPTFMLSVLFSFMHDRASGAGVVHGILPHTSGANICRARNRVVEKFLSMDGPDWLFWVDADMAFSPSTLHQLLTVADPETKPMVGALCFSHRPKDGIEQLELDKMSQQMEIFPTIYTMSAEHDGWMLQHSAYPKDRLVPVDGTGSACILIHRSVFEKIRTWMAENNPGEPYVWYREERFGDQRLGEDLTFCALARTVGVQPLIHTAIKVGHVKTTTLDEDQFLEQPKNRGLEGVGRLRHVIVGSGRSGTNYVARLFGALGRAVGHEMRYTPTGEIPIVAMEGDVSWMALPYLERNEQAGVETPEHVVHVVRNPIDVLRSMVGIRLHSDEVHGAYREFLLRESHADDPSDPVEWLADWLHRCEQIADGPAVHVEDLLSVRGVAELLERLGIVDYSDDEIKEAIGKVPDSPNSRTRADLDWDDLPDSKAKRALLDLAKRWGYETP